MSTTVTDELFICSFCEQKIKVTPSQVGRRSNCPSCRRIIRAFPNKTRDIDNHLFSSWFYRSARLFRSDNIVGPIGDEQFFALIEAKEIAGETAVRSPRLTKDLWVAAAEVDLSHVKELIDQRYAEAKRRGKQQERRDEINRKNRQMLVQAIQAAVADGNVTLSERTRLMEFAKAASIAESEVEGLLAQEANHIFQTVVEESLSDGMLDPHEEKQIASLAQGLGVSLKFTEEQRLRMRLCRLASQLVRGTFEAQPTSGVGFALAANEECLATCSMDWFEVVKQRRSADIALDGDNYLKQVASGSCALTSKKVVLVGELASKKFPLSSVQGIGCFSDGVFFNRSSGKSVFLRPHQASEQGARFAMLAQYTVTQEPVLGTLPTSRFVPEVLDVPLVGELPSLPDFNLSFGAEPRFTFRIVGEHVGDRRYRSEQVKIGERILFVREPTNPHDPNAVLVTDNVGHELGYLKREVAEWFAPILDGGRQYRCELFRRRESGALIAGVYEV